MFTIADIIKTLNEIEVKGKDNMDRLLGAILALEAVEQAQKTTQVVEPTGKVEDDGR